MLGGGGWGNSCQYPFDGDSDLDVIKKVQRAVFEFPDHVVVSEDAKDFVRKLICLGATLAHPPLPSPMSHCHFFQPPRIHEDGARGGPGHVTRFTCTPKKRMQTMPKR